jgi:hypothetical protein
MNRGLPEFVLMKRINNGAMAGNKKAAMSAAPEIK